MSEQSDPSDTDQALVDSIELAAQLTRTLRGKPLLTALRALGGVLWEIAGDSDMPLDQAISVVIGEAGAIALFMKEEGKEEAPPL
jgi:hypothetical protein